MHIMTEIVFVSFDKVADNVPTSKTHLPKSEEKIKKEVKRKFKDTYDFDYVKILVTDSRIKIDGVDHHIVYLV